MKCAHCNKFLVERLIATKTKKADGNLVVLESRNALVCDTHGVAAWDPPAKAAQPYIPYVPYIPYPVQPYRPYVASPNTAKPYMYPVWSTSSGNQAVSGGKYQITGTSGIATN